MELRTQTSLLAAVLSFAIAAAVLLRARKRRVHWLFGLFGVATGAWYLSTFLANFFGGGAPWERVNLICAVLLPLSAVQFFRTFLQPDALRTRQLQNGAIALALVMIVVVLTPLYRHGAFAAVIVGYAFVLLAASLAMLWRAGRTARSRFEQARLTYLVVVGALAMIFTLAEYLPYTGLEIPPVGTVLILVFLYVLSQSILRYRLLDLYELAGRLTLLTALSFSLAGMVYLLVALDPGHFFLHAVVAALVLFLIFDPLRSKLEQQINQIFLRERYDLETAIDRLHGKLAHTLELNELTANLLTDLEASRRVTDAALYLVDESGQSFALAGNLGARPVTRVETALARPLLDRLRRDGVLVQEALERELEEARELQEDRSAETLHEILVHLQTMNAAVCLPLTGDTDFYGMLAVRDDRLRDAFSPEEVQLLRALAAQTSIAIENSRLYQRLKQRDRLAALGEMAAGLAHEIRNPLGAIKASAQYLTEPSEEIEPEFLDIIVEEADRLNRVVSSFLDYARPSHGDPTPTDVNAVIERTLQLLEKDFGDSVKVTCHLEEDLPPVRIDAEQLRQVLINLTQNAVQAMELQGRLTLRTSLRQAGDASGQAWVDLAVTDTGPGIPTRILQHLFVPFVTTKERGTGLGLPISQRLVNAAGGYIEVRSQPGQGTTFLVRLPAAERVESAARLSTYPQSASSPPGIGASTSDGGSAGIAGAGREAATSLATSR
ncbi:MAG: ATP-binding protein [Sandaracinaceae bacterium]